jgi:hypothetical protein
LKFGAPERMVAGGAVLDFGLRIASFCVSAGRDNGTRRAIVATSAVRLRRSILRIHLERDALTTTVSVMEYEIPDKQSNMVLLRHPGRIILKKARKSCLEPIPFLHLGDFVPINPNNLQNILSFTTIPVLLK